MCSGQGIQRRQSPRGVQLVRRIRRIRDKMFVDRPCDSGRTEVMDPSDRIWRERGLRAAVLAGDERAWQALYDESFDALHAYVHWRCGGDRYRAEEIVQETWLTAVRRIGSFEPVRGSFAGWLRGIAANVLRNHFRCRVERNGRIEELDREPIARESADVELERRDRAERIARALAALPDRYEAVLRAKYFDGQSMADIAAAWDQTPKAIESLLTRARLAFREEYLKSEEKQ